MLINIVNLGCIMAELVNLKPLFPGKSDTDQICKIFEIVGTPSVKDMP